MLGGQPSQCWSHSLCQKQTLPVTDFASNKLLTPGLVSAYGQTSAMITVGLGSAMGIPGVLVTIVRLGSVGVFR
jgi:hypothetical protein